MLMVVCQPIEGSKLKSPGITLGYVSWKEMGRRVTEHTVQNRWLGMRLQVCQAWTFL